MVSKKAGLFVGIVFISLLSMFFVLPGVIAVSEPCDDYDLTPEDFLAAGNFMQAKYEKDFDAALKIYLNDLTDGQQCIVTNRGVF